MATIMFLRDNGPTSKMELYNNVSKNPRMPDKLDRLSDVGLVTMTRIETGASIVSLTEKGRAVSDLLAKIVYDHFHVHKMTNETIDMHVTHAD